MRAATGYALIIGMAGAAVLTGLVVRTFEQNDAPASVDTSGATVPRSPFTALDVEGETTSQRGARKRDASGAAASTFARQHAVLTAASKADRKEIERLIAQAASEVNPTARRATLEILFLRYAELDADAALQQAANTDPATAAQLLAAITPLLPQRAWSQASRVEDSATRFAHRQAVAVAWVAVAPEEALAQIRALPEGWERGELLQLTVAEVARREPQRAVQLVQDLEPQVADSLLEVVAVEWARADPSAAARWIEQFDLARLSTLAYRIAGAYVTQKPDEALAWALRVSRSPGRNLWSHMVGQLALTNPDEALRLAQAAENPAQRSAALGSVLGVMATRDPERVLTELTQMAASKGARRMVMQRIAGTISALRPEKAVEWLARMDELQMVGDAAGMIAYNVAQRDVEAAARLIDSVPEGLRSTWIGAVASAYAQQNYERGLEWVRRQGPERTGVAFSFASALSYYAPELALEALDSVLEGQEREETIGNILPLIAQQAPELAVRRASELSDVKLRQRATIQVVSAWMSVDEAGPRKWISGLPRGVVRDSGYAELTDRARSADQALEYAREIDDPERRMDVVMNAALRMSASDPDGVRRMLRRHPLDPQRQRQVDDQLARARSGG